MLKVFTAFDGVGVVEMALKDLNIKYKNVGISLANDFEYDAYCEMHGHRRNFGAMHLIKPETIPYHHLFFYRMYLNDSVRIATKMESWTRNRRRNGLMGAYYNHIKHNMPPFLIMESAVGMSNKMYGKHLTNWMEDLKDLGYANYFKEMNSKYFKVPQSRNRFYLVSILENVFTYEFPKEHDVIYCIDDILDYGFDDSFYVDERLYDKLIYIDRDNTDSTKINQVYKISTNTIDNPNIYRVYHPFGLAPSLTKMSGGGRVPLITESMFDIDNNNRYYESGTELIRQLTPLECWRLMGYDDKYYNMVSHMAKTRLYHLAGDNMVKNVVYEILKSLLNENNELYTIIMQGD